MTCAYESELESVLTTCGCLMADWATNPMCGTVCKNASIPICTKIEHRECYRDIWLQGGTGYIQGQGNNHNDKIPYLAPCEETKFAFRVSENDFPDSRAFRTDVNFCRLVDKLKDSCENEKRHVLALEHPNLCPAVAMLEGKPCSNEALTNLTELDEYRLEREVSEYASRNLVKLDVFYSTHTARKYVWEEKMSIWSFVGDLGGLMGLFLGLSFISLAEIVFFVCLGISKIWSKIDLGNSNVTEK